MKATLLHRCYDQTGEAATWLPEAGMFLWVDIDRGILHQYNPKDGSVKDHLFPEMISSIIPWRGNKEEIIVAMKNRLVAYHLTNGTFANLVDFPCFHPQLRMNDCKASPEGRLWCGVMHLSEHDETGSLYCVGEDLSQIPVLNRQHIPNGIVWNRAGDRMYYADSGRGCIEEYAYERSNGTISLLRKVVDVPKELGVPDGMTIDADGYLWVAHWGGFGVYVWNPENGHLVDKVEVPVPNVASCTFGGIAGNRLFITTALAGLSAADREKYPHSGSLFVVDVPGIIPGENHYPFITG